MVDSNLGIQEPAAPSKRIDAEQVMVAGVVVQRERIQVVGAAATDIAVVTAANGLEVDITRLPTPTGINGGPVVVGSGAAVELTFTGATKVISIKAASTNTGIVWFGPITVTNTGANAFGELTADASVEIELDDAASPIYIISDTAAQLVYKAALT